MLDIVKKHLNDFNTSNWSGYKASYSPNANYQEMPSSDRIRGAEEITKAVQKWKRAFPDLKGTIKSSFVEGDKIVAEVEWEGTHNGPLEGPLGTIQPTGRRGKVAAALIHKIEGGKIVDTRHYFDILTILSQIGAVPRLGTATGGAAAQPAAI